MSAASGALKRAMLRHHALRPLHPLHSLVPSLSRAASGTRLSSSTATPPKFGKDVAAEASAAQNISDATSGRYEYINDFMKSMQKGPVKLEFGDRAPTEKERAKMEAQEKALNMMKRSMIFGSLVAVGFVYGGWVLSKRALGVADAKEFSEAMREKMPKVSGDMEDSAIGRRLKEQSAHSRDAISEDPELTAWRRSLRDKFNTPEGKELARKNSILMAERRQQERIERVQSGNGMAINTSRVAKREVEPEVLAVVVESEKAQPTAEAAA